MLLSEKELRLPTVSGHYQLLAHFASGVESDLGVGVSPIRFAVTKTTKMAYHCEVGVLQERALAGSLRPSSLFEFRKRKVESSDAFNVVLVVPTGIGAEVGGHAGDAAPVTKLMAEIADVVITHPNVVNASDINEMPQSGLYVEGSVLSRLLMGTAGLQAVRSNRILVVIDAHADPLFTRAATNSVNAARTAYGLRCPGIVEMDPPIKLKARYTGSGAAAGTVDAIDTLWSVLEKRAGEYDAIALSSVIEVPCEYHLKYFEEAGRMVNPWGGVEAMLTHAISSVFDIPSAHSPMFESQDVANLDPGVVEPRMAAEAISLTFLQCILKGLHRAPRIVTDPTAMSHAGVLTVEDVSCVVLPDGCLGLPTLAALEQGISVIAVRENKNKMRNDLEDLPWGPDQLHIVENYWEAAGVLGAIRAGIDPHTVRRPVRSVEVVRAESAESTRGEESRRAAIEGSTGVAVLRYPTD